MRHYIPKRNNPYDMPHSTYMSVYYLIRSYEELKQRRREIPLESPPPADGLPKGNRLSDPTADKAAVMLVLDMQLEAIEQTAFELKEKYSRTYTGESFDAIEAFMDYGVFSYYRAKKTKQEGPCRESWTRYRNEFCYKVAKKINYF